jgi:hypothetical protein
VTTPGTNAIVNGNPVLLVTGINKSIEDFKIDIYSKDKSIFVNCQEKANQIYIYDTLGSLLISENNVIGLKKFNMNNDPDACYFVKIVTENNVYSKKVMLK